MALVTTLHDFRDHFLVSASAAMSAKFRVANFQKMKFGTRRRDLDAVDVQGVEFGEGYPLGYSLPSIPSPAD